MPLFEMTSDAFRPLNRTSFADLKVRERDDLQRLLRSQIDVLGDDLYVLTEEFGDWDDSRRRIDLLAIDPQANLVVIELIRGPGFNYVIVQEYGVTELYIDRGDATENKQIFDHLYAKKDEIEKSSGGTLPWERLDTKRACRSKHIVERGGYRRPEAQWAEIQSEMVDTMTKLEASMRPGLESLDM